MNLSQSMRAFIKTFAVVLSVAVPLALAVPAADARIGGGFSSGSRGTRTFSAPPSTSTAPNVARPFDRTMTSPSSPGIGAPGMAGRGGFFSRPGLLGGLAAGFLGAGLFGMLFGGGLFGGLGGISSLFGLILQIGLIVLVARLVWSWWQRRNATAYASGPSHFQAASPPQPGPSQGFGFGLGSTAAPLKIGPDDYEAFERVLGDIQTAWSNEDVAALHRLATPEMVSYFTKDLAANSSRGVVNKVSGVKLLQGDLAEAWREGETDYASVAMRFSLVDKTIDRASGRIVEGGDQPTEATEVWTFQRRGGGSWELSAIQQV
jgi:predicted lipid-binding transport protein (Tim44 family)